jgi:hypothetical protein
MQVMKLLIMHFPRLLPLPLRFKYSPQYHALKYKLCFSLSVKDQVLRPYKTAGEIIILYILIFKFLYRWREDKGFWTELEQEFLEFKSALNFSVGVIKTLDHGLNRRWSQSVCIVPGPSE